MPTIVPRRWAGNAAVNMVRLSGSTAAPPRPCTARAAISADAVGERAQAAEPRVNSIRPGDEDPASAEPVAERGGGDDARRERDAVGVHRPLQGHQPDVQIVLHPRQRRDHDQRVQHHHEVRRRGQPEESSRAGAGAARTCPYSFGARALEPGAPGGDRGGTAGCAVFWPAPGEQERGHDQILLSSRPGRQLRVSMRQIPRGQQTGRWQPAQFAVRTGSIPEEAVLERGGKR